MIMESIRQLLIELTDDRYVFSDSVVVQGKVSVIRRLGKLTFVIVFDQTGSCQVVFECIDTSKMRVGDFVLIHCSVHEFNGKKEFAAITYKRLCDYKKRKLTKKDVESKVSKLFIKSYALQAINLYFTQKGFLPVVSPIIVGSWVEGKTSTFKVDYYGTNKYLTLNNMLYHQIMLISGYQRIFEISTIFRQEHSSAKDRLTEFKSLDISMSFADSSQMMSIVEDCILFIANHLLQYGVKLKGPIHFERISYSQLMRSSGVTSHSGAQIPAAARQYLNNHYDSFVWLYGFPEDKRRFFVKSTNGTCLDYQLWYKGDHQLASGGERETEIKRIEEKILNEGKRIENYNEMLDFFRGPVPPMAEIGFGIDRFLLDIIPNSVITDFVAFARTKSTRF